MPLAAAWILLGLLSPNAPALCRPIRVVDDRGKTLVLPGPPQRIVSAAPSNTEILYALGLEKRIVGVSERSNYPPAARKKPSVGGVSLSYERILSLKPDLVVAFWGLQKANVQRMERLGLRVLAIDPRSVADTLHAIRLLGKATATEQRAQQIVRGMQAKLSKVRRAVAAAKDRPRTLWIVATQPQLVAAGPGTFMDDALRLAGGRNLVADRREQFPALSAEVAITRRPDVIITSAPEWHRMLARKPGWSGVPAVRNRRFYSPPADILERPGPRLADGVLALARVLHPGAL